MDDLGHVAQDLKRLRSFSLALYASALRPSAWRPEQNVYPLMHTILRKGIGPLELTSYASGQSPAAGHGRRTVGASLAYASAPTAIAGPSANLLERKKPGAVPGFVMTSQGRLEIAL